MRSKPVLLELAYSYPEEDRRGCPHTPSALSSYRLEEAVHDVAANVPPEVLTLLVGVTEVEAALPSACTRWLGLIHR